MRCVGDGAWPQAFDSCVVVAVMSGNCAKYALHLARRFFCTVARSFARASGVSDLRTVVDDFTCLLVSVGPVDSICAR